MRHANDDGWNDFPVILGQGSLHGLSDDDGGKTFGAPGARIRVRLKRHRIGFDIPKIAPRGKS